MYSGPQQFRSHLYLNLTCWDELDRNNVQSKWRNLVEEITEKWRKYLIIHGRNLGLVVLCSDFRVLNSCALLHDDDTLFEAYQIMKLLSCELRIPGFSKVFIHICVLIPWFSSSFFVFVHQIETESSISLWGYIYIKIKISLLRVVLGVRILTVNTKLFVLMSSYIRRLKNRS